MFYIHVKSWGIPLLRQTKTINKTYDMTKQKPK